GTPFSVPFLTLPYNATRSKTSVLGLVVLRAQYAHLLISEFLHRKETQRRNSAVKNGTPFSVPFLTRLYNAARCKTSVLGLGALCAQYAHIPISEFLHSK
ncbi:MAG: hypothetical protein IJU92_04180, partial [Spirochaetaceae bacterium]|nr:hypothetical protein [Spirochaetaceae bacterium]